LRGKQTPKPKRPQKLRKKLEPKTPSIKKVGDHLFVDGGMVELVVTSKQGPDVVAESIEQGDC
jgi:hypothetical protein